jgi:hypothetical protein
MVGIAAALIGEVLTGQGALAQLGYELHESIFDGEHGCRLPARLAPTIMPSGSAAQLPSWQPCFACFTWS